MPHVVQHTEVDLLTYKPLRLLFLRRSDDFLCSRDIFATGQRANLSPSGFLLVNVDCLMEGGREGGGGEGGREVGREGGREGGR